METLAENLEMTQIQQAPCTKEKRKPNIYLVICGKKNEKYKWKIQRDHTKSNVVSLLAVLKLTKTQPTYLEFNIANFIFYLPSMGIHHAPFLCLTNIFELEMTQNTVLCSSISCAVLNMQSDEKVIKRGWEKQKKGKFGKPDLPKPYCVNG